MNYTLVTCRGPGVKRHSGPRPSAFAFGISLALRPTLTELKGEDWTGRRTHPCACGGRAPPGGQGNSPAPIIAQVRAGILSEVACPVPYDPVRCPMILPGPYDNIMAWHGWKSSGKHRRQGSSLRRTRQPTTGLCLRFTGLRTATRPALFEPTALTLSCSGGHLACPVHWRVRGWPGPIENCWRVPRRARTNAFIERRLMQSFCVSQAVKPLPRWPFSRPTTSPWHRVPALLPSWRRR
jgi:hypothetical protein